MQEITAWLQNGKVFSLGVELYHRYGKNIFFKKLLTNGPTPYNIQKLSAELEALAPAVPATPQQILMPEVYLSPEPVLSPEASNTQKATDHKNYLALLKRRDEVVRQLDRNMAALEFSNDKTVLHETAKQILRLHQQKQEVWALIDYYQMYECFEPVKEVKIKSREEKMQLIYQSISKAKKRLANPSYPDKTRTQKLIDKKLKELELLKGAEA